LNQQHPLDRQQLKQVLHRNEAIDGLQDALDWAKSHLEAVIIGALVLAAAGFGGVFIVKGQQQKALEASKLLAEAQMILQQAQSAGGGPAALEGYNQAYAKYQAVVSGYDGSDQAPAARLGMANALLGQGKAAEAEREYSALDSRKAGDVIGALAALGRSRSLEVQGKAAEAAKLLEEARAAYPNSVLDASKPL
jgi:TolA-binding protein